MRIALKVFCIAATCLTSVAQAQWSADRLERFAGEFAIHAPKLPVDRAGQTIGALAKLGVPRQVQEYKAIEQNLSRLTTNSKQTQERLVADREMANFARLAFHALSTFGDYGKAKSILDAVGPMMRMSNIDGYFTSAPLAAQRALLTHMYFDDQILLRAGMIKSALAANDRKSADEFAAQILSVTTSNRFGVRAEALDILIDSKYSKTAVDYVGTQVGTDKFIKPFKHLVWQVGRAGDAGTIDAMRQLLQRHAASFKDNPHFPERAWFEAVVGDNAKRDAVLAEAKALFNDRDIKFGNTLSDMSEALARLGKLADLNAAIQAYPHQKGRLLQGALIGAIKSKNKEIEDFARAGVNRNYNLLLVAIEGGCPDLAAELYARFESNLSASDKYFLARNIARCYIDLDQEQNAVKFLVLARDRLLLSDPGFNILQGFYEDLALLFARIGDVEQAKLLMSKRPGQSGLSFGEVLSEGFMIAFRGNRIRK